MPLLRLDYCKRIFLFCVCVVLITTIIGGGGRRRTVGVAPFASRPPRWALSGKDRAMLAKPEDDQPQLPDTVTDATSDISNSMVTHVWKGGRSPWRTALHDFCRFDTPSTPWHTYHTRILQRSDSAGGSHGDHDDNRHGKTLTYSYRPSMRGGQGLGQGLVGLTFAMYLALRSQRTLRLDFSVGSHHVEEWAKPRETFIAGRARGKMYEIWNFGRRDRAEIIVPLLASDIQDVSISANTIDPIYFRDYRSSRFWSNKSHPFVFPSVKEAVRKLRACTFPFLFEDDIEPDDFASYILHLRLGDQAAFKFGGDRRKILKVTGSVDKAVDKGLEVLHSHIPPDQSIFVETDSDGAKKYAMDKYSMIRCTPNATRHSYKNDFSLNEVRNLWTALVRMAAAQVIVYTPSALSESAVTMGPGVLPDRKAILLDEVLDDEMAKK